MVQGEDLHMAQLMPLPLTIFCSSKSRLIFLSGTIHPGSLGQRAVKQVLLLFYRPNAHPSCQTNSVKTLKAVAI